MADFRFAFNRLVIYVRPRSAQNILKKLQAGKNNKCFFGLEIGNCSLLYVAELLHDRSNLGSVWRCSVVKAELNELQLLINATFQRCKMRQEMSSKIYSKLEGGKLFNKLVENTKQKFEDTLRAHVTLDQQKYIIILNK